ncbi:uncharacterized protein LOC110811857 isoform X2 [Carica papaya]|uniref:uncharacterized protein LOC110811857 isoform X2 n=1 Tax=Carica papaya TaxID=3649 RepID=UPI000B8CF687|nr:uncharacterized protein LOC110811857 isoform X2 [Carica papaya]
MEKYLVPVKCQPENPKPKRRISPWIWSTIELTGRIVSEYRHNLSGLLMQSYSEIGVFNHFYHIGGRKCPTHKTRLATDGNTGGPFIKRGISAVNFDNKGVYLVSVTKSGCLTVHDFEALYCQSNDSLKCLGEDESKHVLHTSLNQNLDAVRWNPANQDEVACASTESNKVLIFDIGYFSIKPIEVLRAGSITSIFGSDIRRGLCDIAFTTIDGSRMIASDTLGIVNVWDRRMNVFPCIELTTVSPSTINSIQISVDNQIIFGGGKDGIVHVWDLRGGRTSTAFQSNKVFRHPPLTSLKLASMLGEIESLKAQSEIVAKEIHSINLNPSCPYQLAFHLDDGWSGVLDMHNFQVTHVHCPPPAWLNGSNTSTDMLYLRKPSWLPTNSVYVVGSPSDSGIHMLDFYPSTSSPCHVNYNEDFQNTAETNQPSKQNRFIPLSKGVTACAAHPLNSTVVAGTKDSALLMVSQKKASVN